MSSPYVGEIRIFAGNFAPVGWAFCQGQLLAISENDTLFALIGTTYGGDGQSTFALPNLSSRVPIHMGTDPNGNPYTIGQMGGVETVTLTASQIPAHSHVPQASSGAGTSGSPGGNVWAASNNLGQYAPGDTVNALMAADSLGATGGSQPHDNIVPFVAVNFIISLFGIFPTQN